MSQLSFFDAEFTGKRKVTRREKFLAEMERAVPWKVFADLVTPHYPKAGNERRPYPLEVMLRIQYFQFHQSLAGKADHLAQHVGVGALLKQLLKLHRIVGRRWFLRLGQVCNPNPKPETLPVTPVTPLPGTQPIKSFCKSYKI